MVWQPWSNLSFHKSSFLCTNETYRNIFPFCTWASCLQTFGYPIYFVEGLVGRWANKTPWKKSVDSVLSQSQHIRYVVIEGEYWKEVNSWSINQSVKDNLSKTCLNMINQRWGSVMEPCLVRIGIFVYIGYDSHDCLYIWYRINPRYFPCNLNSLYMPQQGFFCLYKHVTGMQPRHHHWPIFTHVNHPYLMS
jgi:hypothetical protein